MELAEETEEALEVEAEDSKLVHPLHQTAAVDKPRRMDKLGGASLCSSENHLCTTDAKRSHVERVFSSISMTPFIIY
jgi:hypothetical protein